VSSSAVRAIGVMVVLDLLVKVRQVEARASALLDEPVARLFWQQACSAQMFRLILWSRAEHCAMAQFDFFEQPRQDMPLTSSLRSFRPAMYLKTKF